jgi:hypothetical protein
MHFKNRLKDGHIKKIPLLKKVVLTSKVIEYKNALRLKVNVSILRTISPEYDQICPTTAPPKYLVSNYIDKTILILSLINILSFDFAGTAMI